MKAKLNKVESNNQGFDLIPHFYTTTIRMTDVSNAKQLLLDQKFDHTSGIILQDMINHQRQRDVILKGLTDTLPIL